MINVIIGSSAPMNDINLKTIKNDNPKSIIGTNNAYNGAVVPLLHKQITNDMPIITIIAIVPFPKEVPFHKTM